MNQRKRYWLDMKFVGGAEHRIIVDEEMKKKFEDRWFLLDWASVRDDDAFFAASMKHLLYFFFDPIVDSQVHEQAQVVESAG